MENIIVLIDEHSSTAASKKVKKDCFLNQNFCHLMTHV